MPAAVPLVNHGSPSPLANGANAFDVAIIFAANINWDGSKAVLYNNENVQRTLDDAATQIRPLQAKGIKVSLSILGNHQGAGIANFPTQAAAADFAAQVSATVAKYGHDGVDLDEYSIVDISVEPIDGDPAHSGDSIVRGQLT